MKEIVFEVAQEADGGYTAEPSARTSSRKRTVGTSCAPMRKRRCKPSISAPLRLRRSCCAWCARKCWPWHEAASFLNKMI